MFSAALEQIALYPNGLRRVVLSMSNSAQQLRFSAGQYLNIIHPAGERVPLSIASAPWQIPKLEFLYRSDGESKSALAFDHLLNSHTRLQLDGPYGDVTLTNLADQPALRLIAAGTGIAQVLSVVSELQHQRSEQPANPQQQAEVLWISRLAIPTAEQLLDRCRWLKVRQCHSQDLEAELTASITARPGAFNLIAGTPDFVYRVHDQLSAAKVPKHLMAADAFAYAPR